MTAQQKVAPDELISAADQALYHAKRKGRDQFQTHPDFITH
jgi:PleD family two-component response regulator